MAIFHSRLKPLGLGWLFIWQFFFDLINGSIQLILFPLNLVLRASLTFFGMESKRRARMMFILLILTTCDTFDIWLQWWLLVRSKFFSNFFNRKAPSYWQNLITLIICLITTISHYYLVSLHEKNWDHYLLAASQW